MLRNYRFNTPGRLPVFEPLAIFISCMDTYTERGSGYYSEAYLIVKLIT